MHKLLLNPTLDMKIQLLQALPGVIPEPVVREWESSFPPDRIKHISDSHSKLKIIEVRLDDSTLTFHYEEGKPCENGYLFPDSDDEIKEFIRFFDLHYLPVSPRHWLDQKTQILFEVINDEDAGYMVCCRKTSSL